jgi:hypothetical protein
MKMNCCENGSNFDSKISDLEMVKVKKANIIVILAPAIYYVPVSRSNFDAV